MSDKEIYETALRSQVPAHTLGALDRYVERGLAPGGFLMAVLENKLFEAVARADNINKHALPAIVEYIYNYLPAGSWGSETLVEAFLELKRNS
jgi:hypothetical protein